VIYRIACSPERQDHQLALAARDRAMVLDAVDEQLTHQPTSETRHRKLLRSNPLAPWELRIGDPRVYHDVEDDREPVVHLRAIGIKARHELRSGRCYER